MKQCYREINFKSAQLKMITEINRIVDEYMGAGYVLTVRQLYYQLVIRNTIANDERNYKYLTRVVNDARIAGLIDWDAIEDRTRALQGRPRWTSPKSFATSVAEQYHTDPWKTQACRVHLIVEKEALEGVFQPVCWKYDVPLLAARGYPSASVLRQFVQDHMLSSEQEVVMLHFGDHDPSGIDMTRDLEERVTMFADDNPEAYTLYRLALNIDQVRDLKIPPNPAKTTDSRFNGYKRKYGTSSWELDALNPTTLNEIAAKTITDLIDMKAWRAWEAEKEAAKAKLIAHARKFKG